MNLKQKLIYMALGGTFTLLGYTLATLTTNVTAQTDDLVSEATFDKITCKSLLITDEKAITRYTYSLEACISVMENT